jgi:aspartate aminotransferase
MQVSGDSMMKALSLRHSNIVPSPTLILDSLAKAMARDGLDVINLSVGEPDISTPQAAENEAIAAIRAGFTKYTEVAGIEPLRRAVAERARAFLGLDYSPSQVVISNGGKHSLFNIFMTLLDPGDEVIIPTPYWVSYPEQVKMVGGKPILYVAAENDGFGINESRLAALVTPKTKAIVINSPSNPTGAVYSLQDFFSVARIARDNNLYIISDEIYDGLNFAPNGHVSIAQIDKDSYERTIIVNGWSKTYGMTGWRLGYTLSSHVLANAMKEVQGHVTSNVCSIAQKAAIGALTESISDEMKSKFICRRDVMLNGLENIQKIQCFRPDGAFYVFPNLKGLIGARHGQRVLESVEDVCEILLKEYLVSIVPGQGFGAPYNARISYAVEEIRLKEAIRRMQLFSKELVFDC